MFTREDAAKFIERLRSFYGAEFNRKWEGVKPEMLEETVCATFRAVTPDRLSKCFKRISTSSSDFCPSIPTLLAWCFDGEVLTDYEAYRESAHEPIKNPLIHEAIRRVGSWDFRTKSESFMRPAFMEAYRVVKAEFMGGAHFEIPKAIQKTVVPEPRLSDAQIEANRIKAEKNIQQLKKQFGMPS